MKTPMISGAVVAAVMAVWTLVQYFLGWHGEHFAVSAQLNFINWLVWAVVGVIGMLAGRSSRSPAEGFSYGRALGSAAMATLVFGVISGIFSIVYIKLINPDFAETLANFQADVLAQKGVPPQGIEGMRKIMAIMLNPFVILISNVLMPQLAAIVPSLVAGAVVRRPAAGAVPAA